MAGTPDLDLSIVVVSWNCASHVERALASVEGDFRAGRPRLEVFLVDNRSSDGTVERVRRGFPWVEVIANEDNRGFAAANNQALRLAKGRHCLLLNPDTEARPEALATLVAYLDEHPEVGAVGPKLVYPDGRLQRSSTLFPTMRSALHRYTAIKWLRIFHGHYRRYKKKDEAFDQQASVDSLMGAALMVRRSVLDEVGLLDEGFWMYYEEVDLCKRIADAGWLNHFVPDAVIMHVGGESSAKNMERIKVERVRSLLRYFDKHNSPGAAFAFRLAFKSGFLLRVAAELLGDSALWAFWRAAGRLDRAAERAERARIGVAFLRRDAWRMLDLPASS